MGILKTIADMFTKKKGDATASPEKKSDDETLNEWLRIYREMSRESFRERHGTHEEHQQQSQ